MSLRTRFYFFGENSVHHENDVYFCDSHLYVPFVPVKDVFYIRTFSMKELPADFKVQHEGCKRFRKELLFKEKNNELYVPDTHCHYSFFMPDFSNDGYVSVFAYEKQAKITWENKGDHLLVTDFVGRQAKMCLFKSEELISQEEVDEEEARRSISREFMRKIDLKQKLIDNMKRNEV